MAIIISGLVQSRNSACLLTILWQFNVRILRGGSSCRSCLGGDDDVIGEPRLLAVLIEMLRLCSLTPLSDSAMGIGMIMKDLCEDRLTLTLTLFSNPDQPCNGSHCGTPTKSKRQAERGFGTT